MSYDPCGTQRLEGDDILKRLAKYLGVNPIDLAAVLTDESILHESIRLRYEEGK